MTTCGYVVLDDRGVLALRGADVDAFLDGLISSEVAAVRADRSGYGALLTPQGKYLFDFIILRQSDAIVLDTERARLADLLRRLTMYRLRAAVELKDLSAQHAVAAVIGEDALARLELPNQAGACRPLGEGLAHVDPRLAELGARVVLPAPALVPTLEALGLAPLAPEAYEQHRLALGVPDGSRDLVVERSTLLESGFEELNGVSFTKGCFVGQELTARMKHRALVRKRLMPITLEGPPPPPGTIVRLDGRDAGEIRSVADQRGLALLRLEQVRIAEAEGTSLLADGTVVVPARPDWARF